MDRHQDLAAMAAAFRRFNRFYMRQLRPLRDAMRGPGLHASYLRVLRELGESPSGTTATSIALGLSMDSGLVCRILGWFRALGYLTESRDPGDGRRKIVQLSSRGQDNYGRLQARAGDTAEFMLMLLQPADRARLIVALATIETILRGARWDDIRPPPS